MSTLSSKVGHWYSGLSVTPQFCHRGSLAAMSGRKWDPLTLGLALAEVMRTTDGPNHLEVRYQQYPGGLRVSLSPTKPGTQPWPQYEEFVLQLNDVWNGGWKVRLCGQGALEEIPREVTIGDAEALVDAVNELRAQVSLPPIQLPARWKAGLLTQA